MSTEARNAIVQLMVSSDLTCIPLNATLAYVLEGGGH